MVRRVKIRKIRMKNGKSRFLVIETGVGIIANLALLSVALQLVRNIRGR